MQLVDKNAILTMSDEATKHAVQHFTGFRVPSADKYAVYNHSNKFMLIIHIKVAVMHIIIVTEWRPAHCPMEGEHASATRPL